MPPKETATKEKLRTRGQCVYCGGEYAKAGMTKHLAVCPVRQAQIATPPANPRQKVQTGQLFYLLVEGKEEPAIYWLHLEVAGQASLKDLDDFLREEWLECCGHLSAFKINSVRYAAVPDTEYGMDEKSMTRAKLEKVLWMVGQTFQHEYDYGSTTDLNLRVLGVREGKVVVSKGLKRVQLMAQNNAPLIPCEKCGKTLATKICTECQWHGEGWLCQGCAKAHEPEHGDFFLPVVNSPRVGQCGYVG